MKVKHDSNFASTYDILHSDNDVAKALAMISESVGLYSTGIFKNGNEEYNQEFALIEGAMNPSMYLYVLIQQIYAGDVVLVQKEDKLGKVKYMQILLDSISKTNVDEIQKKLNEFLATQYNEKR